MSSIEESGLETYCGLCEKILNSPYQTARIYTLSNSPSLPVCPFCLSYLEKIAEIISTHNLRWAEQSEMGLKWMKSSGSYDYMRNNEGSIDTYLKMHVTAIDEEVIQKDVMAGRTDPEIYEWELHELLARIMKPTYREDICKVLRAYCARNPTIGYCQGMNSVCMWLLIFLDLNSAFWTLSYLIEEWLLPDFYIGAKHGNSLNGFYIESTVIAGFLEPCVPEISRSCVTAEEFSSFFSLQLLIQLFVNTVDLETCIFLWEKLMEEGNIALIRGVVSLISLSKKHIIKADHPLNILKTLVEKRLKAQIRVEYSTISTQVTIKRVEDIRKQARDYRARQWKKCEKLSLRKLEQVSNFNQAEIMELSKIFQEYIQQEEDAGRRHTINLPKSMQEDKSSEEAGIRKDTFVEIISSFNPKLQQSAGLIFDKFDEDKSGLLDFRELTICISIMCKGDFDDKLKLCFDVYDEDKSGFLQPNEMDMLIESLIKPYKKAEVEGGTNDLDVESINKRMQMICQKSGDILCFRDFLIAVKADPELYACFCDHFNIESNSLELIRNNTHKKQSKDSLGGSRCRNCVVQ